MIPVQVEDISRDQEKNLLQEWFDTVHFDKETPEGEIPDLQPEPDDDEPDD